HEKLHQMRTDKFNALIGQVKALPGVENYLTAATDLGLKIGLASSSDRKWVTGFLSQLGLLHYFECIRTSDDVEKVKPDPTLYLEVLHCLDVKPINAIAFEDSPNGALAAKRAGMRCVVVPNPITSQLVFGEFDRRLSSLLEIELAQLINEF
ncbi:MAG: yhcW, partial [Bacilli bacterium]|nr:yhcW [Bacilli bacterium]